jgi:RNA polymerase sigma-70 factor (ECF subfamily)
MYFPTTQWSLIARASLNGESSGREALDELCRRYWFPLRQFIRWKGYADVEADDLAQDFILHLLKHSTLEKADRLRGKFRSFLLGVLVRFLSDQRDRSQAQKRGHGAVHVNLDDEEVAAAAPDEVFFDRQWALTILENALKTVQEQFSSEKGVARFEVLRRFLPGSLEAPSYGEAAAQLGLGLPALKTELHRLRQQFKEQVRQEIASTVSAPHEIEQEMAYLRAVLMEKSTELASCVKPSSPLS